MPDDIDPNRDGGDDDDDDDDDDKDGSVDGGSDLRNLYVHIFDKVLSLWGCTFSKSTIENLGQRVKSGQCWQ